MTVRPESPPVDGMTSDFKSAFGGHPAGVAIITADSVTGPVGITASSVASVCAEPAILAFSLAAQTGSAAAIAVADTVMIHLLSSDDLHLAKAFASPNTERFTQDMEWSVLATGEPRLRHGGYALRAKILTRTQAGNSLLLAAEVLEVTAPINQGAPLVYHQRQYHGLDERTILPGV